jgi:Domain of unknown function (DUF5979)
MRSTGRLLFVAVAVCGIVGMGAVPSGAGISGNTITVVKLVVGTAPAGTTFDVAVNCQSNLGPGSADIPVAHFDANGDPTSPNDFTIPAGQTCTITETENGGATSTTYGCNMVWGDTDLILPHLGNCVPGNGNVVSFTDVIGDHATVTVTNTFVQPAPPPPPPPPPPIEVAPAFTG